jgi:putative FmdB family regulatory protein
MPTYTYACKQCDHRFDQRQSFSDAALTVCPKCAGNLRKVLNSVGVVFKGSGFYRTDSRSGPAPAAKAGAKPDTKSEVKAKAGADSPAKAEPKPASPAVKQPATAGAPA